MRRRFNDGTLLGIFALALAACTGQGVVGGQGGTDGGTGGSAPARKVDKLDILLSIDNSRSMADKQQILSLALADLVQSLANPPCIDPTTQAVSSQLRRTACASPSCRRRRRPDRCWNRG